MEPNEATKDTLVTVGDAKLDWKIVSTKPYPGWASAGTEGQLVVTMVSGNGGRTRTEPVENLKRWGAQK